MTARTQIASGPRGQLMVNIEGRGWQTADEAAAQAVPGVLGGFRRSLANTAQSMGLPLHVQEILQGSDEKAFQALVASDPSSVNVGQALGTGAQVAAGGGLASAGARALGSGALGRFGAEILGSGLASVASQDDRSEFVQDLGQEVQTDLQFAGAMAIAARTLPMAGRVAMAIGNIRPDRREVLPGDAGEVSQNILERLQNQGARLTRGQASGIEADAQLEDAFRSRPSSSGPFRDLDNQNQELLNTRAAESIGLPSNVKFLDDQTLDQAGQDIGGRMTDLVKGVGPMQVDNSVISTFNRLADEPGLDVSTRNGLLSRAKILTENRDGLTPETYQALRQKMTREMMDKSAQGRGLDSGALQEAIDAFDELPVQSLRRQDRFEESQTFLNEYGAEREQWRNFMALTRGKSVDANGNVRPVSLAQNMRAVFGDTFRLDRKDFLQRDETSALFDTVKGFSNPRMIPRVSNSGTATRLQADLDINRDMAMAQSGAADPGTAALMGLTRLGGEIRPRLRELPEATAVGQGFGSGLGAGTLDLLLDPEDIEEF